MPAVAPPLQALPWASNALAIGRPLAPSGNTTHPTSGLIGKRNLQPRSFVTGNTSCTYRVRYPVTVSATKIRMTFPAWSTVTAGTGDEPTGNTVTLSEVYAEYGGGIYPVTFRGATSYTMASGEAITSDEVSGLAVTAGTTLYIRTYVTCPAGGRWPGLYGAFNFPDEVSRPGTNLANGTGDLTGTGQSVSNLYGPLRVFGEIALGQPFYAITICGDSIAAGTNDSFSSEANVGYWQRALWPGNRPFSIVALPGENGTQLLAQGANRADIVGEYVDYVVNQYGINDLQSGATLAQLQARSFANTVISRNPWVNGRFQQTLGPKSSSTDGWTTTGNQTTDGINAARVQFNDWVRDGMPEIGQVAVATGTVGAVRAGQGGHPYTGYIEVADICESARNSGIWKANYTDDGLHPNVNGNLQIAAALDLSALVDTYPTTPPASGPSLALATSPAMLSSGFQGSSNSQAFTSNTFSPPAGSIITVAAQATQSFNNTWNTPTITDSLGSHLTWTRVDTQANVSFAGATCTASLFWALCPSAQTNMTVTVTQSCASGQTVTFSSIGVKIWTGADTTSPIGATTKGAVTSNALGVSLTPTGAGSALMIMANNAAAGSGASSAGTGEYLVDETHTGTSFCQAWYGSAAGPTIPATAQTLDLNGVTARWQYIAFEINGAPSLTSVSTTRITTWGAYGAAATSAATTWQTSSAVAATRGTTWDVSATTTTPVSTTRATTWQTAATVSTTRATTWVAAAVVSTTRATTWTAAAAVAGTRATTWVTAAAVSATRATTWEVIGRVTATRATTWTTSATAATSRATTWVTRAAITSSRATTWTATAQVTTSRATTWVAGAAVTSSRSTTWVARVAVQVTRATSWVAGAQVTSSRATTWAAATAVTSTRATSWATLTTASSIRATTWTTAASVTRSRATTWDVMTTGQVSTSRSTTWTVLATTATTRATTWGVGGRVTGTRATTWAVLVPAATSRATTWQVLQSASATRATNWAMRASVTTTDVTTWLVLGQLTRPQIATWGVLAGVSVSRPTTWATLGLVGVQRPTVWAVEGRVIILRGTTWAVAVLFSRQTYRDDSPGVTHRTGTGTLARPLAGVTYRP